MKEFISFIASIIIAALVATAITYSTVKEGIKNDADDFGKIRLQEEVYNCEKQVVPYKELEK